MKQWLTIINDKLIHYYAIIVFFAVWEIGPRLGWVDAQFIPPLSQVLSVWWQLASTGEMIVHIAISLERTLLGYFFAVVIALPLGFILGGWVPAVARFLRPLLITFAQINAFTLFPLFLVLFGIGEGAKISVIFWSTLWPVLFTTIAGVQQVDPLLVKSARSMGADGKTIFLKVILPGAALPIFNSIRLGATIAFMMLIGAEVIGADKGLGWMVYNSEVNNTIPRLYSAIITIATLGIGMNACIIWLEENIVVWKTASSLKKTPG